MRLRLGTSAASRRGPILCARKEITTTCSLGPLHSSSLQLSPPFSASVELQVPQPGSPKSSLSSSSCCLSSRSSVVAAVRGRCLDVARYPPFGWVKLRRRRLALCFLRRLFFKCSV